MHFGGFLQRCKNLTLLQVEAEELDRIDQVRKHHRIESAVDSISKYIASARTLA